MNVEKDISSLISELDNILTHEIVVKSTFNKEAITTITSKRKILISYEDNDEITLEFEGVLQEVKDLYQMRAIMRLINYFRKTQKRSLDYLQVAHVIKTNKALQIDAYSRLNLELTRTIRSDEKYGSLYWLLDNTKTAMGGRLLKQWISKPSSDINEIIARQDMIQSFIDNFMIRNDVRVMLDEVYDLERLIARISFGNANGRDLLQLKTSLKPLPALKDALSKLNNAHIDDIANKFSNFDDLVDLIEKAISEDAPITIKEGGIFKPGYSPELDEIIALSHGGKKWVAEARRKRKRTYRY